MQYFFSYLGVFSANSGHGIGFAQLSEYTKNKVKTNKLPLNFINKFTLQREIKSLTQDVAS